MAFCLFEGDSLYKLRNRGAEKTHTDRKTVWNGGEEGLLGDGFGTLEQLWWVGKTIDTLFSLFRLENQSSLFGAIGAECATYIY